MAFRIAILSALTRLRRAAALGLALVAGITGLAPAARAQEGQAASYAFLVAVAEAGERCGALEPWEAATIRAQARRVLYALSPAGRVDLLADAAEEAAAKRCTDTRMLIWIDGARTGVLREWLPPYLALFHAFASMASPPLPFLAATRSGDRTAGVAAVEAEFAAFAAAGVAPEGGITWETYLARLAEAAAGMVNGLLSVNVTFAPDDAAAYMVEAGIIVSLWLARTQ